MKNQDYSYDSWGNLLSIKDGSGNDKTNDTAFVGYKNPLRYRGYYYDSETKLYYLQSRYYNPEWGRFINADDILGANGDLISNNLFAYCSNNPVMLVDPSGNVAEVLGNPGFWDFLWKAMKGVFAVSGSAFLSGLAAAIVVPNQKSRMQEIMQDHVKSKSQETAAELGKIAGKYGNLKCVEAANAMEDALRKKKEKGAVITLIFPNARDGYVLSDRNPREAISQTGMHRGVLYKGNVYCNVYPEGLPEAVWINQFYDITGEKPIVTKVYF